MKLLLTLFVLSPLLSSCLKTAEEIQREKMVDSMAGELKQNQSMAAELVVKFKNIQTQINDLNGKIEEYAYKMDQNFGKSLKERSQEQQQLTELVETLNEKYQEQSKEIARLKVQTDKQDVYIKKVNKSLDKLTKSKSLTVNQKYQKALKLYSNKKYQNAEDLFLEIVDDKKLAEARRNRVLQSLGLISYRRKDYEESIVFFSRIYTKWPQSSFAPYALLNIGKSLKNIGQKDQAKVSFSELISKYPKSKHVKTAKNELEKL